MKIVHLSPPEDVFLKEHFRSRCDIREIHEISSLKSLKHAYHELGEVTHSTMFWFSLLPDCMSDDKFWKSLRKLLRYVQKGSGRIVFQMPRKSKNWKDEGVREILESYGLHKVSFPVGDAMISVATNDDEIRDFLNQHRKED